MLWMLSFSISYPDLIKFSHFMDTPSEGFEGGVWRWNEAQRQGDVMNNLSIYTYTSQNIYTRSCKCIWQIFTLASCKLCICQWYIRFYTPCIQLLTLTCTTWKWTEAQFFSTWKTFICSGVSEAIKWKIG